MSAQGSNYPVTFMLQIRGNRQVIAEFERVRSGASGVQAAGRQIQSCANAAASGLANMRTSLGAVSASATQAGSSAQRAGALFNSSGRQIRGSASSVAAYNSSLASMTAAQAQNNRAMGLGRLVMDELLPRMTGLAISSVS